MTPEQLFLAIWGAVLSTILAVERILSAIRDRPDIKVDAVMTYAASAQGADTHGTLFLDEANTPPAWKEANIEIIVRNRGEKPAHVDAIFVEDEATAILVTPAGVPCEIPPKASRRLLIQPELAAMRTPARVGHDESPIVWRLLGIGIVDGQRKKYFASQDQLDRIVRAVNTLPLRFVEDRVSEPGVVRWVVQMMDQGRFFSKREEFVPNPINVDHPILKSLGAASSENAESS